MAFPSSPSQPAKARRPRSSWSPTTFVRRRRWRIIVTFLAAIAVCAAGFIINTRKAVALEVNGQKRNVVTYASSVPALLKEQGITLRTHDQVTSTTGQWLRPGSSVNVKQAYQLTLNIDGVSVPYWTTTNSAAKIASFYDQSRKDAVRLTVNITNVYNRLTGGISINHAGPVIVRWDGKQSVAPDGRLTAASILDSKGITLGKKDRVSVSVENGQTILTVQRVKVRTIQRTVSIPFQTTQEEDPTLPAGQTKVISEGKDGTRVEKVEQTLVDGAVDSEKILSSTITAGPVMRIIEVGTQQPTPAPSTSAPSASGQDSGSGSGSSSSNSGSGQNSNQSQQNSASNQQNQNKQGQNQNQQNQNQSNSSGNDNGNSNSSNQSGNQSNNSGQSNQGNNQNNQGNQSQPAQPTQPATPSSGALTPAEAKAYAQIIMRDQYGWGSDQFGCLDTIWTQESGWRWNAKNPSSSAYGIPQALVSVHPDLPAGYMTDAAVQIQWGLSYIAGRYGTPCQAKAIRDTRGWY